MAEYISREDYCEAECGKENREGYKTCKNCSMLNVTSADVQPVKHGKWIRKESYGSRDNFYYCSECNRIINVVCGDSLSNYPYCHCGARMDGGADDV